MNAVLCAIERIDLCLGCGTPYEHRTKHRRKWCRGTRCASLSLRREELAAATLNESCAWCGMDISSMAPDRRREFCGNTCARRMARALDRGADRYRRWLESNREEFVELWAAEHWYKLGQHTAEIQDGPPPGAAGIFWIDVEEQ